MAFTRFHDDPCRIQKKLQETTGAGRYILNMPGTGDMPAFMDDPFIRMQKWGANLMTNTVNLESDLRGLTRHLSRDYKQSDEYTKRAVKTETVKYPTIQAMTEQPRATHPAWTARDLEQVNWYLLPLDPQENTCFTFENNISTRILEKDNYVTCPPNLKNMHF